MFVIVRRAVEHADWASEEYTSTGENDVSNDAVSVARRVEDLS